MGTGENAFQVEKNRNGRVYVFKGVTYVDLWRPVDPVPFIIIFFILKMKRKFKQLVIFWIILIKNCVPF
jgi:hypothetical protein